MGRLWELVEELDAVRVETETELAGTTPLPDHLAILPDRMSSLAPTEPAPVLEAEEALYRIWWRTLPDKALARRSDGHLPYWGRERGLSVETLDWLRGRVKDLLMGTKSRLHPEAGQAKGARR